MNRWIAYRLVNLARRLHPPIIHDIVCATVKYMRESRSNG